MKRFHFYLLTSLNRFLTRGNSVFMCFFGLRIDISPRRKAIGFCRSNVLLKLPRQDVTIFTCFIKSIFITDDDGVFMCYFGRRIDLSLRKGNIDFLDRLCLASIAKQDVSIPICYMNSICIRGWWCVYAFLCSSDRFASLSESRGLCVSGVAWRASCSEFTSFWAHHLSPTYR